MELGKLGVWTSYRVIGAEHAGEAAKLVESLGFGTFWLGGSSRLPDVGPPKEIEQADPGGVSCTTRTSWPTR